MKIFLLQGYGQSGPYSPSEVTSRIDSGEVALSTLASTEGRQEWIPVSEILSGSLQSPPPLPTDTPIESPDAVPPSKKRVRKQNKDLAICGLTFGIIGAWFAPLAIPAVICGHMALAKLKKFPKRYGGKEMATTGVVLGWLGIVIGIPAMILYAYTKSYIDEALQDQKFRNNYKSHESDNFKNS